MKVYQGERLIWQGHLGEFVRLAARAHKKVHDQIEERLMGYPAETSRIGQEAPAEEMYRVRERRTGLSPQANGRTSPLQELIDHANNISAELSELISRGHMVMERVMGSGDENGLAKAAVAGSDRDRAPAFDELRTAVAHCGDNIAPLRALINRLEAI